MLNNSNATFNVFMMYNLTWDFFFVKVLNFTRQEELELKEVSINKPAGRKILDILCQGLILGVRLLSFLDCVRPCFYGNLHF